MPFGELVDLVGTVFEGAGVATMLVGGVSAILLAGSRVVQRVQPVAAFRALRQNLGRAILLGLEFLVAADIIRTVSTVPTLRQVAVLGGIVVIRTFLSFTLEVELDGRWPWQARRGPDDHRGEERGEVPPPRPPPATPAHQHAH